MEAVACGAGLGPSVVLNEPPDRRVVDGDPIDAMRLGRPQDRPGQALDERAGEPDRRMCDVDLAPAQPKQLAAPCTGRRGQPQIRGEVGVAVLDVGEQLVDLIR